MPTAVSQGFFSCFQTVKQGKTALILLAGLGLAGCAQPFDFDLRDLSTNGFDTTQAARSATGARPKEDNRGIISYPGYQVAVARRGDTVASLASRIGADPSELARYNGIQTGDNLRMGEIIALPKRVAEPSAATGAIQSPSVDVTTLASGAIDNAEANQPTATTSPSGVEPVRHRVERGETAYSIARLYGVPVRALAEWNSLDAQLDVREGQFLLIPVVTGTPVAAPAPTAPGQGSATPTPPSATKALPAEVTTPTAQAAAQNAEAPASPNLGAQATKPAATSGARMVFPASGNIIREYKKGSSDEITIAAPAGSNVVAADGGTVGAVTRSADQVAIVVIKHPDNLLSVYIDVADVSVKKGDTVRRGQTIAKVAAKDPSFMRFGIYKGSDSVNPAPYLK
ncbi:LysM peptidoglycan-binding domain-containing protein [Algirhabdus cladophorae]|uniref:LysM peptidoglycan-binding domain-containing protein n=1 Tax=Algirhabdus cladophorae TaxID=3377108 RepID=UPI003B84813C